MTTFTKEAAISRIQDLKVNGIDDLKKVRAYLVLEDYPNKVIEEAIKELGLKATAKKGFTTEYYDWLANSPKTKLEATNYIKGNGEYGETSNNTIKHLSHFLNIWELTSKVWAIKGEEPEAEEEVNPEIKKAFDKLNRAIKAFQKGNAPKNTGQFHPDKVSYLNDEALTRAYTKFFQDITA